MNWKKIGKSLLFPHIAIIIILLPISIAFLVFSLIFLDSTSIISIFSYLIAFYVLLVICFRIPNIINFFKKIKNENKYINKYFSDVHLRVNISLYGSLIWNILYAIFQLGLGFYHGSLWFYSMFAYYTILATMRFFLLKHTRVYKTNEKDNLEAKKFCICGYLLLAINLALAVIISFIVYWNKTFIHHEITTIAIATYTFFTFTFAIINNIKYRKYKSFVYSATKIISLISACVSMLTLEATMLTTFGENSSPVFRQIMLASTGFAVIIFTITTAIIMIVKGTKRLKKANESQSEINSQP